MNTQAHGRRDADGQWIPWQRDADGQIIRERSLPDVPPWVPRKSHATPTAEAWVDGGISPLEVISRLSTGTTYRVHGAGRGTRMRSLGAAELAAALGYVPDKLESTLALAVATHSVQPWPQVQQLAHAPLAAQLLALNRTRPLVAGAQRIRVRLVLYDAFHDAVLLRVAAWSLAARRVHMRRGDYCDLHDAITGWLMTKAHNGAKTAVERLFREG